MKEIRVYKYGLKAPTENADLVWEQIRKAHAYREALTRLERSRRLVRLEVLNLHEGFCEARAALVAEDHACCEAARAIKAARSEGRTRTLHVDDSLMLALDDAKGARQKATDRFRSEHRNALRDLGWMLRRTDDEAAKEKRRLRAECGVFWGTYLLVEAAADESRKTPDFDGDSLNLPRCERFDGQGAVGVQLHGGLPAADVFADDSRLRIDPVDPDAWTSESRSDRRRLAHTILRMRVGSNGRAPIWAAWRMSMHRALPEGSRVKSATVTVHRLGSRQEWTCEITIEMASTVTPRRSGGAAGVVGVDIGWRQFDDGVRLATWWGSDGGPSQEIRLSNDVLGALDKCAEIRSVRDRKRDIFLPRLHAALQAIELPQWLATRTKTLERWESCNRLHELLTEWTVRGRFAGDKRAYTMLSGFCYRDAHLWSWEASQRTKSLRRRKEGYRCVAVKLAETYHTLVIENFDLRKMAAHKQVESTESENKTARGNRVRVAPSEFRECLVQAFLSRGGAVAKMSSVNTTKECHITGVVESFDAAASVRHTTAAGVSWDQDDNAARNLVQRYCERPGDAEMLGGARKSKKTGEVEEMAGGKFRRARRAKVQKASENGTARETGCEAAE